MRLRLGFALALACVILTGCGKGTGLSGQAPLPETKSASNASEITPAWCAEGFAGRITAVRSGSGRVEADLALPAEGLGTFSPVGFNFCLPEGKKYALRAKLKGENTVMLDYGAHEGAASGQPDLATTSSLTLQFAGVMRDTAVWRLMLNQPFWGAWTGRQKGHPGELWATVEITWADDGKTSASGAAGAGERGMARVLRQFVANPGDLGKWPVRNARLAKGLNPVPNDPRPLAPGAKAWMHFKVDRDGLYKISKADLPGARASSPALEKTTDTLAVPSERAGTPALPGLDRLCLFAGGKPVPLIRTRDAVYFYGWGSRSDYDPNQNYWAALGPDGHSRQEWPTTNTLSNSRLERPIIERIRKTARVDRDNVLKIAHAEFMRIVDATWVDSELVKDTTLTLPLALEAPVPTTPTATLKSVFSFYPEGDPTMWMGTEAELRDGSATLARFAFTPYDKSFDRPVDLPVSVFRNGQTTLTLCVSHATTATLPAEDNKEGVWFDKAVVHYEGTPTLAGGRLTLDRDSIPNPTTGTLYGLALSGSSSSETIALSVNPKTQQALRITTGPAKTLSSLFSLDGGWQAEFYDPAAAPSPVLEPAAWPEDLLADTGADVLILTHAAFKNAATSLTQVHARMGLKTRIVDVQNIYDRFGDGMSSPLAIRAYLGYAASHWKGGAPQYLILLGDCSEDYLDRYRSRARNWVPSYTCVLGEEQWPSDYWYSLISGEDMLPDLIVARLPAATLQDAGQMVEKIARYVEQPRLGAWRGKLTLVADNLNDYRKMAETARLECTPREIQAPRLYLDEMPLEDNWYVARRRIVNEPIDAEESIRKVSAAATNRLKDIFNEGTPVLEYFGHGGPNLWAHERVWFGGGSDRRDTQYLKNDGRYTFIINYTCATGKIDYPIEPWNICIGEDFLRTAGGGAIGLFVPAGFGSPPLQENLMRQWHAALFRDRLRGIGELATLVRARYAAEKSSESHLFMYELLGDPVVELNLVTDWRPLELKSGAGESGTGVLARNYLAIPPGTAQAQANLANLKPSSGKAQVWLENERGDVLWEGKPIEYSGGAISAPVDLPAGLEPPQTLRVGLYAWNESERRDVAAAGTIRVENPAVAIRSAEARENGGSLRFAIELENTADVAANDVKLKVDSLPAGGAPLFEQTLKLSPHERCTLMKQARVSAAVMSAPLCFEAVVITPQPPDDLSAAFPARHRFAAVSDPKWLGWAPALGHFRDHPGLRPDEVTVVAMGASPPEGALCAVWHSAAGDQDTTLPLVFSKMDGAFVSSATLPMTMERKPAKDDLVELVSPVPGAAPRVLDRMSLSALPREAPRLKLDPQSIRHTPSNPSPTDGETIFVTFKVTNEGNAPSLPCQPALLNKPYANGGRPLSFRSVYPKTALGPLGPGRSASVTLRWDPVDNAGVQTIIIDTDPVMGRSAETLGEETAPYRIFVRTKSRLSRGKPLPPVRVAEGVYKLRVEVVNEGETDARNVEVNYFRTPEKKAEDLLGTVLLKVIPAARDGKPGTATASLECPLDEKKDRPVSEVRLKGSAQTITE